MPARQRILFFFAVMGYILSTAQPDSTFLKAIPQKININSGLDSNSIGSEYKTKLKDSLNFKGKPLNKEKFRLKGSINNQFDYGAIPYYMAGRTFPANLYRSYGTVGVRLGKIPLIMDYFYSSAKFVTGLNNYFTVRFDVNEFQKIVNEDYLNNSRVFKTKLDSLNFENQKLKQQLALLENQRITQYGANKPDSLAPFKSPTSPSLAIDTSRMSTFSEIPSFVGNQGTLDSLKNIFANLDTTSRNITALNSQINKNEREIITLQQKISVLENPRNGVDPSKLYPQTRFPGFLSGVKRFEVGMCYPSYSTFMINQMALRGVNFSYSKQSVFVNTSLGKTVVNYSIQSTPSSIINQVQQLTSLVDWGKNPNEKKIGALKVGYGKEDKSYIAIGGLFGHGTTSPNQIEPKNNFVIEIDGKYVYKFLNFEGAVAKSFLIENHSNPNSTELPADNQKTTWSRSIQGKIYGTIPKTKTKLFFLHRTVEPFFKSYGVGFMRSDIMRHETKLEQPIGSKLKIGLGYRRDEDNLRNLLTYKTVLENFTYYAKFKLFKKRMDIALNYTDIFQRIKNYQFEEKKFIKSNIKTVVVSYSPRFRRLLSSNTIIANQYELSDGTQKNILESYSFNSFNTYRKWAFNNSNIFIHNTIRDSLNINNALSNTVEAGYQFSSDLRVSVGGKHAYEFTNALSQFGYSASVNWRLHKLLNFEIKAEKLVIGDFMNSLNYSALHQFPYYGYIKITSVF